MKFAFWAQGLLFLVPVTFVLGGCAMTSGGATEEAGGRAVFIRLPALDSGALSKVTDCLEEFRELEAGRVRQALDRIEKRLRAQPNVPDQVCLALVEGSLATEPEGYARPLSLLDDSLKQLGDDPELLSWVSYLKGLLTEQAALLERERRLLAERSEILRRSEAQAKELEAQTKELTEAKAAAARLEQGTAELKRQLDELKSIESSILQRDIEEDAAKP